MIVRDSLSDCAIVCDSVSMHVECLCMYKSERQRISLSPAEAHCGLAQNDAPIVTPNVNPNTALSIRNVRCGGTLFG